MDIKLRKKHWTEWIVKRLSGNNEIDKETINFGLNNYANEHGSELLNLYGVVASLPSKDEELIGNMCLSYRHDFGLLSEQERNKLMNECKNWLISYEKNRKQG